MYYLWSLLVSLAIFAAIQYKELQDNKDKYNLWSFANISTLVIIYLLSTITFYMLFGIDYNCVNKIKTSGGNNSSDIHTIDPVMLRRIPDKMYTGFAPYNDVTDNI